MRASTPVDAKVGWKGFHAIERDLWQGGAIDIVAALSLINIVLVGIGLAIALRFGVKLRD